MEVKKKAALFIDGQNMLPFRYDKMHKAVGKYNTLIKRVYLPQRRIDSYRKRNSKLIEALQNNGFEIISAGRLSDVDTYLVIDAMEVICERNDIENIILASTDGDFVPLINKAKLKKKYTILITKEEQRAVSSVLKSLVHEHIEIPTGK